MVQASKPKVRDLTLLVPNAQKNLGTVRPNYLMPHFKSRWIQVINANSLLTVNLFFHSNSYLDPVIFF